MVSDEQQYIALPKLYGAPAYARPKVIPVSEAPKPFDPDDLPLEAFQTPDEREWASALPARAYQPGGGVLVEATVSASTESMTSATGLHAKSFRIRAIAGRFLGTGDQA